MELNIKNGNNGGSGYSLKEKLESAGILSKETKAAQRGSLMDHELGRGPKRIYKTNQPYNNIVTETIQNIEKKTEKRDRNRPSGNGRTADRPPLAKAIDTALKTEGDEGMAIRRRIAEFRDLKNERSLSGDEAKELKNLRNRLDQIKEARETEKASKQALPDKSKVEKELSVATQEAQVTIEPITTRNTMAEKTPTLEERNQIEINKNFEDNEGVETDTIKNWQKEAIANFTKEAEKTALPEGAPGVSTTTAETVAATLPSPEAPATAPAEVAPEVEIAKALETLSPKEKKEVALGLENIGYYIEEKKNKFFASTLSTARELGRSRGLIKDEQYKDKEGNVHVQAGALDRFLQSFSENMTKNAELNHKKMEDAERTNMSQITSVGTVAGNVVKYGRVFTDLFGPTFASPLRYVMMGGMFFGQASAAMKEARFKNEEVLEKTRVQDINAAAEEAWKIHEQASKEEGGTSLENLRKAYLDNAPLDILKRLQKDAEPGTASSILEKILKSEVEKSIESISSELDRNENDSSLSLIDKKIKREQLLQKYAQKLGDYDRAVSQFGTVDTLAMGAKYGEFAAKVLVGGMMVETVALSIDKLWEKLPSLFHSAPEVAQAAAASTQASNHASGLITPATPDNTATGLTTPATPGSAVPLLGTNEEILKLATIRAGDGVTHSFVRQLMQNPQSFGFKSVTGEADEIEEWAFDRAVCLAEKGGYINAETGAETRINTAGIGNVAYVLGIDSNGTIQITEEIRGSDGKFQVNPEGVKSLNKYEYASTPEINAPQGEEAPANAGPTVTDKATRITMNDAWWTQYTAEHPNEDYTEMRKIIGERAAEIALYQDKLDSLSQKGQGDSYYADFLREKLEKTIIETEKTYGDVFNDVSAHTNPAEIPHSPESSAPVNTAHEGSVSSLEFPSYASDRVHDEVNKLFGSNGFLGFGAQDGTKNANWIAFSGIPAEDVINAKHSVIEGSFFEGGRGYGMDNNESIDKMQGLISEEIKRTGGKITPTKNETVEHFLNRMAEVKSSVEERVVPKVEIQHAPEKVAVTSRVLPPPPPAPPVPGVLPPPPRL